MINAFNILILCEEPTQGLDVTKLTAEAKYPINFTQPGKEFVLSLHYHGSKFLLMLQKYVNSKQKTQNQKIMHCVYVIFYN